MNTSARNQIAGTVSNIVEGAVNAEVEIALAGGRSLVAQITIPSVRNLGLEPGRPVAALIKSSWVVLGVGDEAPRVSTRNKLKGVVVSIVHGAVNSEIALDVDGTPIVATVTNESVAMLGLAVGGTAWALIKASSVILAA